MKFATIIREAGIAPKLFPNVAEKINVVIYDLEGQTTEDDVKYAEGIFDNNRHSFCSFIAWLDDFENNMEEESETCMDVQITRDYVVLFYNTNNSITFRRNPGLPMSPLDYMA